MRNNAVKSFEFLDKNYVDNALLENFTRIDELDFGQDRVISLKEYFETHSIDESKNIIDDFVKLSQNFLRQGFIDKAMKIGKNFGINDQGRVILIDIGEIWFKKDEVQKRIRIRTWAVAGNCEEVPFALKKYYLQEMDKIFLNK